MNETTTTPNNFFNLPHIFVVFAPGASGNFIASILTKILDKNLGEVAVSGTGNAHANSISRLDFSDVISCGLIYGIPKFVTEQHRLEFYKAKIEEKHSNDTDVKVAWSHDFSNIPLYKTLFPNCRILVVSQSSRQEKLAVMIQQELKNRLDPNGFVFLQNDPYLEHWRNGLKYSLIMSLGYGMANVATDIANNYMDVKYKPIVTFFAIDLMLRFYGQEFLVSPSKQVPVDYLEYCVVPRFVENPNWIPNFNDYTMFNVGPKIESFITDDCAVMPYDVIMNNNLSGFLNAIEKIVGTLDSGQIEFVKDNLNNYHRKQSPGLMDDPIKYYYSLAKDAQDQIKILKGM
jgi:hypothetical protein